MPDTPQTKHIRTITAKLVKEPRVYPASSEHKNPVAYLTVVQELPGKDANGNAMWDDNDKIVNWFDVTAPARDIDDLVKIPLQTRLVITGEHIAEQRNVEGRIHNTNRVYATHIGIALSNDLTVHPREKKQEYSLDNTPAHITPIEGF